METAVGAAAVGAAAETAAGVEAAETAAAVDDALDDDSPNVYLDDPGITQSIHSQESQKLIRAA